VRSRDDLRRLAAVWLTVTVLALPLPLPLSARQTPAETVPISAEEIAVALAAVERDPNVGGETTMKMLRWRQAEPQASMDLSWVKWIAGLVGWVMESARYLMWAAIVLLVAWIAVYLTRSIRGRQTTPGADAFVPPTHVRNLDIRPESLPANIGRAARTLWDKGDHRAALSLLYRGLLSRLTHVHRVPIRDSSTEGDCLVLLTGVVPPKTGDYSARLVGAWQGMVYGGTDAPADAVYSLCDDFAGALDRAVARPAGGGSAE
jgi:hypothetical protein